YVLKTRVDTPHNGRITSLVATVCGDVPLVVTTGEDGRWKTWCLRSADNAGKYYALATVLYDKYFWACRSACEYRGMAARGAAFSEDASVLAVAFDNVVTLWDPLRTVMNSVLPHPVSTEPIRHLGFVAGTHYLVVATDTHLHVWNLLTCSVWWSYRMNVRLLAVDTTSAEFTVAGSLNGTHGDHLVVFDPASPTPRLVLPYRSRAIAYAQQPGSQLSQIIVLNTQNELHTLSTKAIAQTSVADTETDSRPLAASDTTGLFSSIFGKTEKPEAGTAMLEDGPAVTTGDDDELWTLPAHVMPGVHLMYSHFVASLLRPVAPKATEGEEVKQISRAVSQTQSDVMDLDVAQDAQEPMIDEEHAARDAHVLDMLSDLFRSQLRA
ncbi:hypothetical protein THASP1DRAFT_26846, partial [Thamnocephalis sphaerospora]